MHGLRSAGGLSLSLCLFLYRPSTRGNYRPRVRFHFRIPLRESSRREKAGQTLIYFYYLIHAITAWHLSSSCQVPLPETPQSKFHREKWSRISYIIKCSFKGLSDETMLYYYSNVMNWMVSVFCIVKFSVELWNETEHTLSCTVDCCLYVTIFGTIYNWCD